MFKLKNIKPTMMNRLRWIFLIAPILWLILIYGLDFLIDYPNWFESILIILLLLLGIIITILMMVRKETITKKIIRFMIILACVSGLIYLLARYVIPLWRIDRELDYMVREGSSVIAVYLFILLYIIYFRFVEIIMPLSILIILTGLLLNRIGAENEAVVILLLGFGFVIISYIYVIVRSILDFRDNRFAGRILFFLGLILVTINATFFVNFSLWEAASINTIDYVGVLCFIGACLILFASLPFLDFIEWSRTQKRFFYRVFIIPMLFLFLLFSLKFLIPGNAYQKLFFPGYKEKKEEKEKVYFNMKKYEIKEPDKEKNK